MALIKCVCISKERKARAYNVHSCRADLAGLEGDIHVGLPGKPSVSLLPQEVTKSYFQESMETESYGRFGENLVIEGLDWGTLQPGDRLRSGDTILEIIRIGAGGPASEAYHGEKVCSPMEPWFVFCKIAEPGILQEGSQIEKMGAVPQSVS